MDIFIISDAIFLIAASARPPMLIARELAKEFDVIFIAPKICLTAAKTLKSMGINFFETGGILVFPSKSLVMFYSWAMDVILNNISYKVNEIIKEKEDAIILNFSNTAMVKSSAWYAQGMFYPALIDIVNSATNPSTQITKPGLWVIKLLDAIHVRRMRAFSKLIIANSIFTRRMYESAGIKVDKIIYPPLDTKEYSPTTNSPTEDYALTYIGKETDFRVMKKILDSGVKIKAFGGKFGMIPKSVLKHKNFEYLGFVPTRDLIDLYSNALFTLFPFSHEPFGYVPLESLACGTPVLTYNKQGPAEIIQHGKNGWLVNSCTELVRLAKEIWDKGVPSEMRKEARKRALEFSVEKIAKEWIQLINTLAG